MDSYAEVLESYLIPAEEGLMDTVKNVANRIVAVLKGLKDKIIAFFKKIFNSIKSKNKNRDNVETESDVKRRANEQYAYLQKAIHLLQDSLGHLSRAVGASKTANDTDDDSVQNHLEEFNERLDKVSDFLDSNSTTLILEPKLTDALLARAENVKNSFVQELDLAIKIASSANYNMANTSNHMSQKLANQLCTANSKFMRVYTTVLNRIDTACGRSISAKAQDS